MHELITEYLNHAAACRERATKRLLDIGVSIDEMCFVRRALPGSWKPTDDLLAPTTEVLEVRGRPVWQLVTIYGSGSIEAREQWLDQSFVVDVCEPVVFR